MEHTIFEHGISDFSKFSASKDIIADDLSRDYDSQIADIFHFLLDKQWPMYHSDFAHQYWEMEHLLERYTNYQSKFDIPLLSQCADKLDQELSLLKNKSQKLYCYDHIISVSLDKKRTYIDLLTQMKKAIRHEIHLIDKYTADYYSTRLIILGIETLFYRHFLNDLSFNPTRWLEHFTMTHCKTEDKNNLNHQLFILQVLFRFCQHQEKMAYQTSKNSQLTPFLAENKVKEYLNIERMILSYYATSLKPQTCTLTIVSTKKLNALDDLQTRLLGYVFDPSRRINEATIH